MRSLFRQKTGNTSSPGPTSPKKSHRLSNILSPTRFRSDNSDLQGQAKELESPAIKDAPSSQDRRPATSPASTPPPERTPPHTQSLGHVLSSDGPSLPTSEPHHSFATSNGSAHKIDYKQPRSEGQPRREAHRASSFTAATARPTVNGLSKDDPARFSTHVSQGSVSTLRDFQNSMHSGSQMRSNEGSAATNQRPYSTRYNRNFSDSLSSPNDHFETPATRVRPSTRPYNQFDDEDQLDYGDSSFGHSSLGHRLSSPSAAAAHRSKQRAASAQTWSGGRASSTVSTSNLNPRRLPPMPRSSEPSRVSSQHLMSQPLSNSTTSSKDLPPSSASTTQPISKRPPYLQDRQASQRSSKHSIGSRESEATGGADDYTTSGGRTPGERLESKQLSRLPSFGSLASSHSGTETGTPRGHKRTRSSTMGDTTKANLDRVIENRDAGTSSLNTTPRASQQPPQDPSDTVVARHVRDVEVSPTVERQYKASQPAVPTTDRFLTSSPYRPQAKNNFSLKEQNEKVDKLTKENFGLKLKIHFLHQSLEARSDEGVAEMLSKHAQLQADNQQLKRDNARLRKQVKQLERQLAGRPGAPSSIAPSGFESEDGVSTRQLDDEIGYLHQRMQTLEFENMQLTGSSSNQHLLEQLDRERQQKEEAFREIDELRQQMARMRGEVSPKYLTGNRDMREGSRPRSKTSRVDSHDTDSLSGNTLVSQLQSEKEGLENKLHSQETMLHSQQHMIASGRKERDRLVQELENLKLLSRRGDGPSPGSNAGDSILDRSVSRQQQRAASRTSDSTHLSQISDRDRERFETIQADLREENARLKMHVQDLERAHNGAASLHLKQERDEAMNALMEADNTIEKQAVDIEQLEDMVLQHEDHIKHLDETLDGEKSARDRDAAAFQAKMQELRANFEQLVDEAEGVRAENESLREGQVADQGQLHIMEQQLKDERVERERMEVQAESSQNEIQFLREEQETDKVTISDLQTALRTAKAGSRDGNDRHRELEVSQRTLNESREDNRQLRRSLGQREAENRILREKLEDASGTIEEFNSKFDGAEAGHSDEIAGHQRKIRHLTRDLDRARESLQEKEQALVHRDGLLESASHETRQVNDLLNKERQGRKHDRNEFERSMHRAKGTPEVKVLELERSREAEKQRVAELEQELAERTERRDRLLQTVWNRLTLISNTEGLAEHQATFESSSRVGDELPSLMRRLPLTLDAISTHVTSFRTKVRDTEREISKDFQHLSEALADRSARLEALESLAASQPPPAPKSVVEEPAVSEKYAKMKEENKQLRREVKYLKQGSFSLPGLPSSAFHQEEPTFDPSFPPTLSISTSRTHNNPPAPPSTTNGPEETPLDTPDLDAMPSPLVHHGPRSKETEKRLRKSSALVRAHSSASAEAPAPPRHDHPPLPDRSLSTTNLAAAHYDGASSDAGSSQAITPTRGRDESTETALHHQTSLQADLRGGNGSADVPQRSSSALATTAPPGTAVNYHTSDKTWLMRLEDMRRKMKLEREGRLMDREGARKRLKAEARTNEELRAQLRRERDRRVLEDVNSSSSLGRAGEKGSEIDLNGVGVQGGSGGEVAR